MWVVACSLLGSVTDVSTDIITFCATDVSEDTDITNYTL